MVPNQQLLQLLIHQYYSGKGDAAENGQLSSHWRYYSQSFEPQVDRQGNLVALSGASEGFETYERKGTVDKVFDFACMLSHLVHLSSRREILRLSRSAYRVCKAMGLPLTTDVFRQVCSLATLKGRLIGNSRDKRINVLMIGDGYGVLGALFKEIFPNSTIVMVDIGRSLLFQAFYCQKAHPGWVHELANAVEVLDRTDFVYCPAEYLEPLERFKYDLAINIASMHEMGYDSIKKYFRFLRRCLHRDNLFYCCNREFKVLMGGEVTHFMDYPWHPTDKVLIDELCPWHQYFFSKHGGDSSLQVMRVKIPWINFYKEQRNGFGRYRHRLVTMATTS